MYTRLPVKPTYLIEHELRQEFLAQCIACYVQSKCHCVITGFQSEEAEMKQLARTLQQLTPIGLVDHVDFTFNNSEELLINGANIQLFCGELGFTDELLSNYALISFHEEVVQVVDVKSKEVQKCVKNELYTVCFELIGLLREAGIMQSQALVDEFVY